MLRLLYDVYRKSPPAVKRLMAALAGVLRRATRFTEVDLGGYVMCLDPADNAALSYHQAGRRFEQPLVDLFLECVALNDAPYVLDVGANYGFYTLAVAHSEACRHVERIFAFEPAEMPCAALTRSLVRNGMGAHVTLTRAIVGETSGLGTLVKSGLSSLSTRAIPHTGMGDAVPVIALDTFLAPHLGDIHAHTLLIKIDIEGNEPKAFRGLGQLLTASRGFLLPFEYYPHGLFAAGAPPARFRSLLGELAIDCVIVEEGDHFVRYRDTTALFAQMAAMDANPRPQVAANFLVGRNVSVPARVRA